MSLTQIRGISAVLIAVYGRSVMCDDRSVQDWIVRAFLVEEQKIVKKVLKLQKSKEKTAPKS
ncbi:hypothetical protein F2Q68_00011794 [Brassica cretica]|uniref:Uncharacterized protein n=1 Tax=Brassica cretica TaxID=69181 RepID=A0A8S9L186_BRACR|nr:hypothetical protein F2Q68_00011794 [Brassica cretica]